ncbi:Prenylcysteine lyase-domain-containing protein [Earliella scabrosa]|nr:Prenylcysteine lyase-domain-containing protein [Earliella scabrosa]
MHTLRKFIRVVLVSSAALLGLFSVSTAASQLPVSVPPNVHKCSTANRIAIIGAGAAGSSAALWLRKAAERHGLELEVDLFERNDYIGGRSTIVQPYNDPTLEPVELGGSVFVSANKNMWRAVDEYGFERMKFENDEDVMGIWDGEKFVLTVGGDKFYSDWITKLKILWRYGYNAPQRTQALVDKMISSILRMYDSAPPVFNSITSLATLLGWTEVADKTSLEYLRSQEVDDRWSLEFVEAITRINYGQDIDRIHGLEGLVSLASNGASTVIGGNRQVYERFVKDSNAALFLNTTVESVSRSSSSEPWILKTSDSEEARPYRAVILAAPFHQTGIRFTSDPPIAAVPPQDYVHLHVTLVTTSSPSFNPSYFNLAPGFDVPAMILTTRAGARQGGPEPEFNSLSYLRAVRNHDLTQWRNARGEPEWVVKVFSKTRISDSWLEEMFQGKVGWVLRKEWDAYPVLDPTTEFPPVRLADGLYYVNAFEPLISTIETEILSARNVVDILLGEHFNSSICGAREGEGSISNTTKSEDFVYGWDC